jgi:hypothetical protein
MPDPTARPLSVMENALLATVTHQSRRSSVWTECFVGEKRAARNLHSLGLIDILESGDGTKLKVRHVA